MEILLVALLGLAVAGLLYRFVTKFGARRAADHRPPLQVRLDRRAIPPRVPRRPATAWVPHEGKAVIDDLPPSLVPAAGDFRAGRPLRGDGEHRNNAGGTDSASRTSDPVKGRENKLAQLIVDLEQLLQSKKEA
jgi:hypothetical protein